MLENLRYSRERIAGKAAERVIFGLLSASAETGLMRREISHAVEVKGVLNSGKMTEDYILSVLERLEEGTTEIYLHPGCLPDAEITRQMPDYRHELELKAILSQGVKKRLKELEITLCNYRGEEKPNV